jgi:tetratricopeptide (TPR) repeat protein
VWRKILGRPIGFTGAIGLTLFALIAVGALASPQSKQVAVDPSSSEITLQMILVSSPREAQEILDRLKRGEDFGSIAKEKSIDPSADTGGAMGRLSLSELRAELRDGLNGVQAGQVSGVIQIPTGYAILKVISRNDPPRPAESGPSGGERTMSFASSRAVGRQTPITSGVPAVDPAFFAMPKPAGWNRHMDTVCQYHQQAITELHDRVENLAKPENAANASPSDRLGYQYVLGLVESYQGHMSEAVKHWEEAYRIVLADLPESVPLMEEVLGDAYFHKAEMENNVYRKPGDRCIFPPRPGSVYPKFEKTEDVEKAMQHFVRYLDKKPDDLQVKWMLNLAYMTLGQYPQGVPRQYLISEPAQEAPGEGIGRFVDVAPEAGLDVYQISGGLIVEDFENKGFLDVVTSGYDSCDRLKYFHNNGDGTFTDRSEASGLAKIPAAANLIQTDYNNDGCIDILALRGGWQVPMPLSLLRNNCDGTFTDVTHEAGLDDHLFATQTAAWADIDNDGWLDVFIADEQGPSQLYHNKGDGTFENISAAAGVDRTQFTKGIVAEDYDNDGYPDFFVSNLRGDNFLYHNNHNRTFTDVAAKAGVQQSWFSFGTWFFDYDNDGWPDLFIANDEPSVEETMRTYLGMSHKIGTLKLFKNMRNGTFADVTAEVGLDKVFMPMGANYGDVDNDGYLDFFLGTGNPEYGGLVPDVLMRNKQGKSFTDITVSSGTGELHKTHAIVFADLENNGNEDIIAEMGGAAPGDAHALRLFRNPGHDNRWITVKLVGVKTNRAAVGARVTVTTKDRDGNVHSFYRTVNSRGSWGSSSFEQHIGLGTASEISEIEIWWPTSNTRQEFKRVGMDQYIQIKEFARGYTKLKRKTYRIGDPQHSSASASGDNQKRAVGVAER